MSQVRQYFYLVNQDSVVFFSITHSQTAGISRMWCREITVLSSFTVDCCLCTSQAQHFLPQHASAVMRSDVWDGQHIAN